MGPTPMSLGLALVVCTMRAHNRAATNIGATPHSKPLACDIVTFHKLGDKGDQPSELRSACFKLWGWLIPHGSQLRGLQSSRSNLRVDSGNALQAGSHNSLVFVFFLMAVAAGWLTSADLKPCFLRATAQRDKFILRRGWTEGAPRATRCCSMQLLRHSQSLPI